VLLQSMANVFQDIICEWASAKALTRLTFFWPNIPHRSGLTICGRAVARTLLVALLVTFPRVRIGRIFSLSATLNGYSSLVASFSGVQ
jgi:hypothetical protein